MTYQLEAEICTPHIPDPRYIFAVRVITRRNGEVYDIFERSYSAYYSEHEAVWDLCEFVREQHGMPGYWEELETYNAYSRLRDESDDFCL